MKANDVRIAKMLVENELVAKEEASMIVPGY